MIGESQNEFGEPGKSEITKKDNDNTEEKILMTLMYQMIIERLWNSQETKS